MSSNGHEGRCYEANDTGTTEMPSPQANFSGSTMGDNSATPRSQLIPTADAVQHHFREQQPSPQARFTQQHRVQMPQQQLQQQQPYVQGQVLGIGRGCYTPMQPPVSPAHQPQLQENQFQQSQCLQEVQQPSTETQQGKHLLQHQQQLSHARQSQQQETIQQSQQLQHPYPRLSGHQTQQQRFGPQVDQRQLVLQRTSSPGTMQILPGREDQISQPHIQLTTEDANLDVLDSMISGNDKKVSRTSLSVTGLLVRSSREVLQAEDSLIVCEQLHNSDMHMRNSSHISTIGQEQSSLADSQSVVQPPQSHGQHSTFTQTNSNQSVNSPSTSSSYQQYSNTTGQVASVPNFSTDSIIVQLSSYGYIQGDNETYYISLIKSLVHKMKKGGQLGSLVNAITKTGGNLSECVTIKRDSQRIKKKKDQFHVLYFKIWRTHGDDLDKNDLVHVDHCIYPFEMKLEITCVNPYHYEIVRPDNDLGALTFQEVGERKDVVVPTVADGTPKIVHFLMRFRKRSEDKNYAMRAIEYLVRKLKKNEEGLESLIAAIKSVGCCSSNCVPLERTENKDGFLTLFKQRFYPHTVYSYIWRWPDLDRRVRGLYHVEQCKYKFNWKYERVCVNPYHCVRTDTSRKD